MSPKLIGKFTIGHLFIILGLLSAILTFVLFKYISKPSTKVEIQKVEKLTKPIVVAKRYISTGEVIKEEDVIAIKWPLDFYPRQAIYKDVSEVVGHSARIDIVASQPVYQQSISGAISFGGLRSTIPKGMRAITIGVSELKGVAGFIRPGDKIDIIGTFDYMKAEGSIQGNIHVTQTLMQNIQVLAVAQNMEAPTPPTDENELAGLGKTVDEAGKEATAAKATTEGKEEPKKAKTQGTAIAASITLAVTPEQAQVLTLAESEARLKISLRPEVEEEQVELESASEPDLLTDASLFQKVYNYVVNQSSLIAILTASANAASTSATNSVNAAAAEGNISGGLPSFGSVGGSIGSVGNGNSGNSGGGAPGMPGGNKGPSGNRIQVIEGTQVSDVYVKPR